MRIRAVIAVTILGVLLFSSSAALAQDKTPVPGPEATKHLPSAKELGKGWVLSQTVSPDVLSPYAFTMSPDTFREGAAGIYLGPQGAQVIFVSLLISTNRVAVRKSWDDSSKLLDAIRMNQDYHATSNLATADPPTKCVEAKRTLGTEEMVGIPVGGTMCAVDPDGILIAITFGDVNGTNGVAASDGVIELALGVLPATPTPTPAA